MINPKKYGVNGVKMIKDILFILMEEGIEYCKYHDLKTIRKKKICLEMPNENEFFNFKAYKKQKEYINILYECLLESKKKQSSIKEEKKNQE